jgi:acyl carrier protein
MRFSEEEITTAIIKLIFRLTHKTISSDKEELVESGILNSITIAELAVELEKTFAISVSFMEINKENFADLFAIKKLVQTKLK